MSSVISPLAPLHQPTLPPIDGVTIFTCHSGLRYQQRDDILLMTFAADKRFRAAGVFTTSKTRSAAVDWCRRHLKGTPARALICNAGHANAFTGTSGDQLIAATARAVAKKLQTAAKQIFIASTGIIGAKLPKNAIAEQLPKLRPNDWQAAAKAIMTTDTFFKVATQSFTIDGMPYHLNGIAKGSGMIAPSMATMLVFMATDAPLPQAVMQATLASVVDDTFNAITVDSDTSTSDTCLLWAPERRGTLNRRDKESFADALRRLCHDLALQVVRDGEGAQKLIEVVVEGAKNNKEAKQVAMSIANSPLVKTAIAGGDANWGRVVMAVGKSGARADRDRLAIYFGDTVVAKKGEAVANYDEAPVARHLAGREVIIRVNLHLGVGRARVWSCDLTHGYIDINADYRS